MLTEYLQSCAHNVLLKEEISLLDSLLLFFKKTLILHRMVEIHFKLKMEIKLNHQIQP